jgi:hypothetical protein
MICFSKATIVAAVLTFLLAVCPVALAADGQPVFGSGNPYEALSQLQADSCQWLVTCVVQSEAGPNVSNNGRVIAQDMRSGTSWYVRSGAYPAPVAGGQSDPVAWVDGELVRIVYVQADTSVPGVYDTDLWIWEGSAAGVAAAGFPKLLVSGPALSQQMRPSIGVVEESARWHLLVAWEDDRDNGPLKPNVYVLDLSRDGDTNGTPDYKEAAFAPSGAGRQTSSDRWGASGPDVGPKGIFYLQDGLAGVDSWQSRVAWHYPFGMATTTAFFTPAQSYDDVDCAKATSVGGAWLGPALVGGPFQPYSKSTSGGSQATVFSVLYAPGPFDSFWETDTTRTRYALSGRHGGTDGDFDVFFYDTATRQTVSICTVGSSDLTERDRLSQNDPVVCEGPEGTASVTWDDVRHNASGTAPAAMTHRVYVAGVPSLSLTASRVTLRLGRSVTLATTVAAGFPGKKVMFQTGKRTVDPIYKLVRYTAWNTRGGKTLSKASRASWTWTPTRRGTFYVRAWFGGATMTSGPVSGRWVGNASRVIRIVVR